MKSNWLGGYIIAAFTLFGCTDESSEKKNSPTASNSDSEKTEEGVTPPAQISGTYLYCDIIDNKITPENTAEVGCRASNSTGNKKLNLDAAFSSSRFSFQKPGDNSIRVNESIEDDSSAYHIKYSILGGNSNLTLDSVKKMMIMFKGSPLTAQPDQFVFAARLVGGQPNDSTLPEDFLIYYRDGNVLNQPQEGFEARVLPTVNSSYPNIDGCYIACYSYSSKGSVYRSPSGPGSTDPIFVMGQFRVKGFYSGSICEYGATQEYIAECGKYIPACAGGTCWGGADTGGFFGL